MGAQVFLGLQADLSAAASRHWPRVGPPWQRDDALWDSGGWPALHGEAPAGGFSSPQKQGSVLALLGACTGCGAQHEARGEKTPERWLRKAKAAGEGRSPLVRGSRSEHAVDISLVFSKLHRFPGRPCEQPQQQQQQPGLAAQSPQEEGHQVLHRPLVRQEREGPAWTHWQGCARSRLVGVQGTWKQREVSSGCPAPAPWSTQHGPLFSPGCPCQASSVAHIRGTVALVWELSRRCARRAHALPSLCPLPHSRCFGGRWLISRCHGPEQAGRTGREKPQAPEKVSLCCFPSYGAVSACV